MGIPAYFNSLIKEFPDIISNKLCSESNIGRIFLDLNCCIHPCAKKINDEFYGKVSNDELEQLIIRETIDYIDIIVKFTKPKDLIYIAIDGVPPRAKMSQQRLRRYKSIKEKKTINKIKKKCNLEITNSWDSNAITPGTYFMKNLSDKILEYIMNLNYKDINTIFSDSRVEGEGEHKILQYIRNNSRKNDNYDIIYGLDADLIMLALSTNLKNIALLREKIHFKKGEECKDVFLYLMVDKLRNNLFLDLNSKLENSNIFLKNDELVNNFIKDYIFLCMFLGNDFIPHIPSLSIKSGGIDIIIDIYTKLYSRFQVNLIDGADINYDFLISIMKELLDLEDKNLNDLYMKRQKFKISYSNSETIYEKELKDLNYYPILNKDIEEMVLMGQDGWRSRYYSSCYDNISFKEYELDKICANYIEGLHWTALYYFDKCPSWKWYFKHRHCPSVYDLYNYLIKQPFIKDNQFNKDNPVEPFVNLMMVLPIESFYLLPDICLNLITDINHEISMYYPIDYKLDSLNKMYYWECIPILPDIELDKISKLIKNCKFKKTEIDRNSFNKEINVISKKNFSKIINN